jgi:hypothetical protein
MDDTNTASILVFNDYCRPFCINKNVSQIDVNQIPYPGGGTSLDPTFLKAAEIIKDVCRKQNKNAYFFYISNG